MITLSDIMKEILQIKNRQDELERLQPATGSSKQNWRHSTPMGKMTQEQQQRWDSQRRNQFQASQSSQRLRN